MTSGRVGGQRHDVHEVDLLAHPYVAVGKSPHGGALGSDGLRGELTLLRAARALAAFNGDDQVTRAHLRLMATVLRRFQDGAPE